MTGFADAPKSTAQDRFVIAQDTRPSQERLDAQDAIREAIRVAAGKVESSTLPGRYQSLALTSLEEALMWSGKAVFEIR